MKVISVRSPEIILEILKRHGLHGLAIRMANLCNLCNPCFFTLSKSLLRSFTPGDEKKIYV